VDCLVESCRESDILNDYSGYQSQAITDNFVESLTEIGSFFLPQGVAVAPVGYANDVRKTVPLESNILFTEIAIQQIIECGNKHPIRLDREIAEGFCKPPECSFSLPHTCLEAKIFKGRTIYRHSN